MDEKEKIWDLLASLNEGNINKKERKKLSKLIKEEAIDGLRDEVSFINLRAAIIYLEMNHIFWKERYLATEIAEEVLPYIKNNKKAMEIYQKVSLYIDLEKRKELEENYL